MTLTSTTTRHLDHVLATAQREGRLPSVAAGLVRDGSLVWSGAVGTVDGRADGALVDDDTQYRMGSITKTFVGVAVLRLRDEGALDLTDRFGAHVPGSRFDDVTVEQLLTHSAGVQAETDGPWWERTPGGDWDDLAGSGVGQRFRAGRRFHYTNVGFGALGRLLEVHHGRGWFDVVREDLLEPLGMTRTTTRPTGRAAHGLAVHPFADVLLPEPEHDAGAMAPAGQLWTTVPDLARWATFLGGDTAGLLSADTLAEMLEPHHVVDEPGRPGPAPTASAGRCGTSRASARPGTAGRCRASSRACGCASTTRARVTASSSSRTRRRPRCCGRCSRTCWRSWPSTSRWSPSRGPRRATRPSSSSSARGTGVRRSRRRGSSASTSSSASPGSGRGSRFRRVGEDLWEGLDGYHTGEPLRVVRRADGAVSHLDLASFRFTRTPYDPEADVPGGVDDLGWR